MDQVTCVIPVHGKPGSLATCLSSFRKYMGNSPVIVVDDCSPGAEEIRKIADAYGAQLIRRAAKGGFAACANTGITESKTKYICLADRDLEFTRPVMETIENRFKDDAKLAALGGLLLNPEGQIVHGGGYYQYYGVRQYGEGKWPHQAKLCSWEAYRFFVSWALMALDRDFWKKNPFDERFRDDFGDADFCVNAWKLGRQVFYDPQLTAVYTPDGPLSGGEKPAKDPERFRYQVESQRRIVDHLAQAPVEKIEQAVNALNRKLHPDLPRAFVRTQAMGDVLRTLSDYRALGEEMVVITFHPEVFRGEKVAAITDQHDEYAVSEFLDLDLSFERRPFESIEQSYRGVLGFKDRLKANRTVDYKINALDWLYARRLSNHDWEEPFVVVHARVGKPNKNLPVGFWQQLVHQLTQVGFYVVNVGANYDLQFRGEKIVNLVGKTDTAMLRALLERAKLFIGMDSGPLHLADGACPAIGIFTIVDPKKIVSDKVTAIASPVPCQGCLHRQKPPLGGYICEFPENDPKRCMCISAIRVDQVFEKAMELLREGAKTK